MPLSGTPDSHNVVEPPPSRFNAFFPPNILSRCANSGIFIPSARPRKRPFTVTNRIFPSLVVQTALRGCLVWMKFSSHRLQSHALPFSNNSGPDANTVPRLRLYFSRSLCSTESTSAFLFAHIQLRNTQIEFAYCSSINHNSISFRKQTELPCFILK